MLLQSEVQSSMKVKTEPLKDELSDLTSQKDNNLVKKHLDRSEEKEVKTMFYVLITDSVIIVSDRVEKH